MSELPKRTLSTMSDAIAMSSPAGRMSRRARRSADEALCTALFGKPSVTIHDLKGPPLPPMTAAEKAAHLRGLARLGSRAQARKLNDQADAIEAQSEPAR